MDGPLHRLLVKAGIAGSAYTRALYWDGVRLERHLVLCPDRAAADQIRRLFLEDLRAVVSDLEVRVAPPAAPPSTGSSLLNAKGRAWAKKQAAKLPDLL